MGEGSAYPSRLQETPANLYLQGLSPSAVKVKVIFCFYILGELIFFVTFAARSLYKL